MGQSSRVVMTAYHDTRFQLNATQAAAYGQAIQSKIQAFRLFDIALTFITLYLLKRLISARSARESLPPGPRGWPIIHNLFDWPPFLKWGSFSMKIQQLYGDISHFNLLGTHMIVVNSFDMANEMMQRKGAIYSDRPGFTILELANGGYAAPILNDGPELREMRRVFAQEIGSVASISGHSSLTQGKIHAFIRRILRDSRSEKLLGHVQWLTAAIIMDVTYGYEVKEEEDHDHLVDLIETLMTEVGNQVRPGAHFFLDNFPWLARLPKWVPGTTFHANAAYISKLNEGAVDGPFNFVMSQLATGHARPSVLGSRLDPNKSDPYLERLLKWTGMVFYTAGAETSTSALYGLFLLMTLYPEMQARAQEELDSVLGRDQLPTFADRARLPYVNALVTEVLRCIPLLPTGLTHRLRENDVHNGYFIPKDSLIVPNIWYMARDPRTYKRPEVFDPTRFLGPNPELDPRSYIFGFGRRVCAGRHLADYNIFLECAMILATLNISRAVDKDGREIIPQMDWEGTLIWRAKEFPCKITPRRENIADLLAKED